MPKMETSKILCVLILAAGLCFSGSIYAAGNNPAGKSTEVSQQKRTIKGTVTDELGPVTGASIVVKGTTLGTISDLNGLFSIEVSEGQTLVVSFIGYVSQEIRVTNQTSLDIRLVEDAQTLSEVVVTALGVKREKKALGYAVQELKGDAIIESREVNVTNALSGKISGLQVIRSSNGPAGSSKIVLRGYTSLTGDNQPLIVVDGVPMDNKAGAENNDYWNPSPDMGNGLSDINPEDIESMSVLKGGSAAALYGSRAGNGVILITTKTGKRSDGLGITLSSSVAFETVFMSPKMQSAFGQGENDIFDNRSNYSWGPRIEGQSVTNWNNVSEKMAAYDNIKNYFDTGTNLTESITFQQQYGKSSIYTSLTRTDDHSKIPGSTYKRTNLTARAVSTFGKDDRWTTDTKVQFIRSDAMNRPSNGNNASNPFFTMYLLPRSMDIRGFNPPTNENGSMLWYGGSSQVNPYWAAKYNLNQDVRDRFLMSGSLKYKFTDWLDAEVKGGTDMYTTQVENKLYAGSPLSATGRYTFGDDTFYENNFSFLVSARKDNLIDKLGASASFGGNLMSRKYTRIRGNSGDLEVPNLFSINNGQNNPTVDEGYYRKKINSLYGTVQLNWDGYLFLDGTFRNDWSSALSKANRSFFYPSVSVAYVFSDMMNKMDMELPQWISFAKIRGSFAQVGNDLDQYQLYNTYVIGKDPNGNTTARSRDTLFDSNVKSELITTYEAGAEIRFFNNRLGFDFAWYKSNATRQLINLPMDPLSGYNYRKINAGDIQNEGIELMMNARILEMKNSLTWDLLANFSTNKNKVKSLADGVERYAIGNYDTDVSILAVAGGDYGEIYGTTFKRVTDKSSPYFGKMIVDDNGLPQRETKKSKLGTQQASSLLGVTNTFGFKGFSLSFLIDCRFGGQIFSGTNNAMQFNGTAEATAPGGNRDKLVVDAVVPTGNTYAVNTKEITAQDYWRALSGQGNLGIIENNIYDATNIRLRNIQLNYSFAKRMLAKTPFQQVKLGVSCNNVWMIKSNLNGVDPESVFAAGSNAVGFENAASPTSRSYLFNVTLGF